jgi:hypothetical protein
MEDSKLLILNLFLLLYGWLFSNSSFLFLKFMALCRENVIKNINVLLKYKYQKRLMRINSMYYF